MYRIPLETPLKRSYSREVVSDDGEVAATLSIDISTTIVCTKQHFVQPGRQSDARATMRIESSIPHSNIVETPIEDWKSLICRHPESQLRGVVEGSSYIEPVVGRIDDAVDLFLSGVSLIHSPVNRLVRLPSDISYTIYTLAGIGQSEAALVVAAAPLKTKMRELEIPTIIYPARDAMAYKPVIVEEESETTIESIEDRTLFGHGTLLDVYATLMF